MSSSRLLALLALLALAALAAPASAQTPCYAENDGNAFNDAVSMGGPNLLLAIRFTASANVDVGAIEVFTGERTGTNSLALWSHDPGLNQPASSLGSGTWSMSTTNSWQGASIAPAVALTAGTTYWVVWGPVNSSQASVDVAMASLGQPYRGSFNGGASWSGPFQFNDRHWKFRFYCAGSSTFCTAKAGLVCGSPSIDASGSPSASATSGFVVRAAPARADRLGVLLYNTGTVAGLPFQGGTLCVSPQTLRRGGPTNSLGTQGGCDGVFAVDMNAFAQGVWVVPPSGAIPANTPAPFLLSPGQGVACQFWGRDSVATGSFLSDGVEYVVGP